MPESPITRKEKYLAKISGETVTIPSPITREEQYLYEIAVNGTGGGGEGGTTNYNDLENKPSINGVTLSGNKTAVALSLYTISEIDSRLSEKADLSLFEPMTQEEYEAIPEDERTEPIYLIYEDETEGSTDNVSNSSGTNSMNAIDNESLSPMSDTWDYKASLDDTLDTLNDTIENPDTLDISEPETEISTDEIKPVSDLTVQGDETE